MRTHGGIQQSDLYDEQFVGVCRDDRQIPPDERA